MQRVVSTLLLLNVILAAGRPAAALSVRGPQGPSVLVSAGDEPSSADVCDTFLTGRFSPLEKRLFDDAADRRLTGFTLLEVALIASGVEDVDALNNYRARMVELADEIRQSCELDGTPARKAQDVFEFMHRRVLSGGYRIDCTDLRTALDHGRFNCVSASVLFNCLAGEVGLRVCGLENPGHAMSRVFLPEGTLDLETTCPRWFRLMGDPSGQAEAVEKTIGRMPSHDQTRVREVSPVEIAAMIYYNRGVDLLSEKRFAEAAIANAKAMRLDPSNDTARGNFLATINNWAIDLAGTGRYAEAVDLLHKGLTCEPTYDAYGQNYIHVHYQWVEHLCRAGRLEEAIDVLAAAGAKMPEKAYFRRALADLTRRIP